MLPLAGLRILTVEQFGAGPYGSMALADLGAEVIKLETPGIGDATRHSGPYFMGEADSQFFQTFNRNKRSLTVDLKAPEGQAILRRLVPSCDAVMNNLRGDQPAKLGLDYAALGALKPEIVCGHLSAYGRVGSRAAWPGYDFLMQGEAGWMHLSGEPDGPPVRCGVSIVDFMTGTVLALALVAAILAARRDGRGCDVDTSLFDVALHQTTYPATWYLNERVDFGRKSRSSHLSNTPAEVFPSADGWVWIVAMTPRFWRDLCAELGRPDLPEHPDFATGEGRRVNREKLQAILDPIFQTATTATWIERLVGKCPVGPVLTLAQAMDNPYLAEAGLIEDYEHPTHGRFKLLASPIRLNGERLSAPPDRRNPAPALGGDTEALLTELGYDADAIAALRAARVV